MRDETLDRGIGIKLEDGLPVYVRPISAADRPLIAKGIRELSDDSRHLRFFSWFKEAPEPLLNALSDVDGSTHIACGALDVSGEAARPIAAVHAFRGGASDPAVEVACAVADAYQGRGVSQILIAAVFAECRRLGVARAIAEVLPSNRAARTLFQGLGGRLIGRQEVHRFEMDVAGALAILTEPGRPGAIADVLAHLETDARPTG
ncbi:MAG: GNAT family N-acetyltransferase [Silicimonas sp.]|nr:GNAT family N-acetyltransferase [Silicimonas sp.]